jgi:glycerol uptake facilitator protein
MPLKIELVGEVLGTFLLVFFGCGSVCTAVTTGTLVGGFQVAMVWGLGIALAISLTGGLSGAHLNPAVTITLAVFRGFPGRKIAPYLAAQLLGAFLASAVLFLIFSDAIAAFEKTHAIARGASGSEASAMVFGEYFPNPGGKPLTADARAIMPAWRAFTAEIAGTGILVLVILGLTDERNSAFPKMLTAPAIGLTVTILIAILGPLTMACFNPARDLGPRLFSALAGWGWQPFETNGMGWLTVYCVAPVLGGLIGGLVYRQALAGAFARRPQEKIDSPGSQKR